VEQGALGVTPGHAYLADGRRHEVNVLGLAHERIMRQLAAISKESRENRTVGRSDRDNARVDRVPIAEAAERLGVSRDTLERLIRAGRLKRYRRFGDRKTYVDLDEAKQVLDWRDE
jgi:excisionase family DNA binding protein